MEKNIDIDKIFENLHKAYEDGLFCKGCKYEKYASCGEHPERCDERIKEVITRVRNRLNKCKSLANFVVNNFKDCENCDGDCSYCNYGDPDIYNMAKEILQDFKKEEN